MRSKSAEMTILAVALIGLLKKKKKGSSSIPVQQQSTKDNNLWKPVEETIILRLSGIDTDQLYVHLDRYSNDWIIRSEFPTTGQVADTIEAYWRISERNWEGMQACDYDLTVVEKDSEDDLEDLILKEMKEDADFLREILLWKLEAESSRTSFPSVSVWQGNRNEHAIYAITSTQMNLHEDMWWHFIGKEFEDIRKKLQELDPEKEYYDDEWGRYTKQLTEGWGVDQLSEDILRFLYEEGQFVPDPSTSEKDPPPQIPLNGGSKKYQEMMKAFPWMETIIPHKVKKRNPDTYYESVGYVPQFKDLGKKIGYTVAPDPGWFHELVNDYAEYLQEHPETHDGDDWIVLTRTFKNYDWLGGDWDNDIEELIKYNLSSEAYKEYWISLSYIPALLPPEPDYPGGRDLALMDVQGAMESYTYESNWGIDIVNIEEQGEMPWWKLNRAKESVRKK